MSFADLSDSILTWLVTYGPVVLAGALLLGALGVPLPGTLFVIATGAFVRQEVLELATTLPIALLGVVTGDVISYSLGRGARGWILQRWGKRPVWQRSEAYFQERGGSAVYLTRWLITPLAIPTNLVAGSSGYRFGRFLLVDTLGELTWLGLYGGLGYAFGSQWELISEFVSNFSGVILGVVFLVIGGWLGFRHRTAGKNSTAGKNK